MTLVVRRVMTINFLTADGDHHGDTPDFKKFALEYDSGTVPPSNFSSDTSNFPPEQQQCPAVSSEPSEDLSEVTCHVSEEEMVFEVQKKLQLFLRKSWMCIPAQDKIHVVTVSLQKSACIQRSVVLHAEGNVELFVHNKPVNCNTFTVKANPTLALRGNTINTVTVKPECLVAEVSVRCLQKRHNPGNPIPKSEVPDTQRERRQGHFGLQNVNVSLARSSRSKRRGHRGQMMGSSKYPSCNARLRQGVRGIARAVLLRESVKPVCLDTEVCVKCLRKRHNPGNLIPKSEVPDKQRDRRQGHFGLQNVNVSLARNSRSKRRENRGQMMGSSRDPPSRARLRIVGDLKYPPGSLFTDRGPRGSILVVGDHKHLPETLH
ncbi:Protein phosphatase PTC7-like protein fig [Frankliniella fusca]|uniref:Protein phosphatase PTC7-like protein fig n=1 Tax=Frankliniella fusca TaxID=407009 RepID=A0AAE1H8I5_9NEOP|nr:Protein phosphatase PTC7-like protein fig [Frankliniella fusca]